MKRELYIKSDIGTIIRVTEIFTLQDAANVHMEANPSDSVIAVEGRFIFLANKDDLGKRTMFTLKEEPREAPFLNTHCNISQGHNGCPPSPWDCDCPCNGCTTARKASEFKFPDSDGINGEGYQ